MSLIDSLQSRLGAGVRTNIFRLEMSVPTQVVQYYNSLPPGGITFKGNDVGITRNSKSDFTTDFDIMVTKINMPPPRSVEKVEIKFLGESFKVALNREMKYDDIKLTIKEDPNFLVRSLIERWMDFIAESNSRQAVTSGTMGHPNQYKTHNFKIHLLNNDYVPIRSLLCYGVFPSDIDGFDLDKGGDAIPKDSNITFTVDNYVVMNYGEVGNAMAEGVRTEKEFSQKKK
jgi:hypothetical protein